MISKKTEDKTVDLLRNDTSALLLEKETDLDDETRQVLRKLVLLEEDLEHIGEIFPPVPEFDFSAAKRTAGSESRMRRRGPWVLLPLAAVSAATGNLAQYVRDDHPDVYTVVKGDTLWIKYMDG